VLNLLFCSQPYVATKIVQMPTVCEVYSCLVTLMINGQTIRNGMTFSRYTAHIASHSTNIAASPRTQKQHSYVPNRMNIVVLLWCIQLHTPVNTIGKKTSIQPIRMMSGGTVAYHSSAGLSSLHTRCCLNNENCSCSEKTIFFFDSLQCSLLR